MRRGGLCRHLAARAGPFETLPQSMKKNLSALSALLVAVMALLVAGATWKGLWALELDTRESAARNIKTVLGSTQESIRLWAQNYIDKARIISIAPPLIAMTERQLALPKGKESLLSGPGLAEAREFISARHGGGKAGYFIIAPDFINLVSSDDNDLGMENIIAVREKEKLAKVFSSGQPALIMPIFSGAPGKEAGAPAMFVVAPIKREGGETIALLALAIDPVVEFSAITHLGRIGATGEAYALDRAGRMLTDSRFPAELKVAKLIASEESGILALEVRDPGGNLAEGFVPAVARKAQPLTAMAQMAVKGQAGCLREGYRDYRGVPALGCWLWDETLDIGLAAEISQSEALGSFYQARILFCAIIAGAVALSALLAAALTVIQSRYAAHLIWAKKSAERAAEEQEKLNEEMGQAVADVRRQEQLLQTIIDNTTAIIYLKDRDGKYLLVNRRYARLLKSNKEAVKEKTDQEFFPKAVADRLWASDMKAMSGGEPVEVEEEAIFGEKKQVYLSMKYPLKRITGEPYAIINISTDITERKRAEEKLQLAASVFENSVEGVIVTNADGVIQSVNPAFTHISGYGAHEAMGKKPGILRSGKHEPEFYKRMWDDLISKGRWEGEIWNRKKSGEPYLQKSTITAIKDFSGAVTQYASVFYDITEMRRSEQEVEYKAYHDALTGLPNRQLFIDRLKHAIVRAQRSQSAFSVLFVDLDGFKLINDSLGHAVGDLLLKGVAIRLFGCARQEDTVARLGGDEFTVIVEDTSGERDAAAVAHRIIHSLSEPFVHKNEELFISSSVGIALYPQNGETAEELLKNADLAMYNVKMSGKNNFQFFTPSLNEKAVRRHELESKLRKALEKNEIFAVYQPKVDLSTGRMCGMEALMRWRQPNGEFISPAEFIPVAEDTGMIRELDEWMLDTSCAFMKKLLGQNLAGAAGKELSISINFSARDLEQTNFVDTLIGAVKKHGISPRYIEVELTENALVSNIESAVGKLRDLRECGFNISIDDFGTGYSSLSYLVKFPIHYLKLDRSFVVDLFKDPDAKTVAKAVVSMAHEINVKVVAEGVETAEQLAFLSGIGCDMVQGYIFCKPSPMEKIIDILEKNQEFTSV